MFVFGLYSADGDDLGQFVTAVPNWDVGDRFQRGDGRRLRIVALVPDDDLEPDGRIVGLWVVEPV